MNIVRAGLVMSAAACLSLAQAQTTGSLCVKANPGRTGVFLDGKYLGPAANFRVARTYSAPAGSHELKLVDPRYEEVVRTINIAPGKKTKISEALKPLPSAKPPFGALRTWSADKFAAVYINDRFFGHAGEFNNPFQAILLNPGDYTVRIEPASGPAVTRTAHIEAGKTVVAK